VGAMFRIASFKSAVTSAKKYFFAHCDEKEEEVDHTTDDSDDYDNDGYNSIAKVHNAMPIICVAPVNLV
jgi:hypothetical protein